LEDTLLNRIIMHTYSTVPSYNNIINDNNIDPETIRTKEDLVKLPLFDKNQIKDDIVNFLSLDYNFKNDPKGELTTQSTAGNTGQPFIVFWTKRDYVVSISHHWRYRNTNFGINSSHRFCSFFISEIHKRIPAFSVMNNKREICFNKRYFDDEILEIYYEQMLFYKPNWLFIQPSIAYMLSGFISENGLKVPPSIKYIELVGEHAFPSYRAAINDVFNVPTSNMYWSAETNGIAHECSKGNLHIVSDNVVVEILNNGNTVDYGQEGDVYVTSLCNTAMPFIRYRLDDRAILFPGDYCDCGNIEPVIRLISKRNGEFLFAGGDGSYKGSRIIHPIERMSFDFLTNTESIKFQIIQIKDDVFTVSFIKNNEVEGHEEEIKSQFKYEMEKTGFENFNWEISFVDSPFPEKQTGIFKVR
jgi:phenylacetate-CoA ligase